MDTIDIDLHALLKRLHLPTVKRLLPEMEVRAAREGWTYRDFLAQLIAEECAHRNQTRIDKAVRAAQFPFLRTVEGFDFTFQPTVSPKVLGPYLGPDFVTEGRNLVLIGKPGRGKTHIAIAIAYRAIQNRFLARFVKAGNLIDDLARQSRLGNLTEATDRYVQPDVLVIDEVGYLHHQDRAANVLYDVIDRRCTLGRPIIFTTNKEVSDWGWVLHDPQLAEVLLDRVLERGDVIRLGGLSHRTRGRLVMSSTPAKDDPETPSENHETR